MSAWWILVQSTKVKNFQNVDTFIGSEATISLDLFYFV